MSDVALFVRLALAAVFALAAVGKFFDIRGSQEAVKSFGVPQLSRRSSRCYFLS